MLKMLTLSLVVFSLCACANTIKESNCATKDWVSVGYDTAKKGKSIRTFDEYIKSCGTNLDSGAKDAYIDGYTKGVIEYCTFENGYEIGSTGRTIPDICPHELRQEFLKGYKKGSFDLSEKIRVMKGEAENEKFDKPDTSGSGSGSGEP